jgi:hypothetical protein
MAIPWQALVLVVLLILALGLMFALVFRWMQRAEQSSYLGTLYQDSVLQLEKNRLCQAVEQMTLNESTRRMRYRKSPGLRSLQRFPGSWSN